MPQLRNTYHMAMLLKTAWTYILYIPALHSILDRYCTPCFMEHPVHGPVPQSSLDTYCMACSTEQSRHILPWPALQNSLDTHCLDCSTEQAGHTLHALFHRTAVLHSSLTCMPASCGTILISFANLLLPSDLVFLAVSSALLLSQ